MIENLFILLKKDLCYSKFIFLYINKNNKYNLI